MKKTKPGVGLAVAMAWIFGILWAGTLIYTLNQPAKVRADLGEAREMEANWKKWYFQKEESALYWMRRERDRQIELRRYEKAVEYLSAKCDHCWHVNFDRETPYPDRHCCWCAQKGQYKGGSANKETACHGPFKP